MIKTGLKREAFHHNKYGSDANGHANALGFAVTEALTENRFIFPLPGFVTLLSDAFQPHKLSQQDLTNALNRPPNLFVSIQSAIKANAATNGDFYFIDCDTSCLIYLAIGQLAGYDVAMVEIPGHNFIRLDKEIAWDPNEKRKYPDVHYINRANLPRDPDDFGTILSCLPYLKPMTHDDILGYWHCLVAWRRREQGRHTDAAKLLERAYTLAPKAFYPADDWARFLVECREPELRDGLKAVSLMKPVVECWAAPYYVDTLAAAYAEAHDFDHAVETEKQAIEPSKTWKLSHYFDGPPWPKDMDALVVNYGNKKTLAEYQAANSGPHTR